MRIVMIALAAAGCATVGAGEAGVLWRAENGTDPTPLGEGWHYVSPRNDVKVYDLRVQQRNEKLQVLAANGLSLALDTTVRYHVVPEEVAKLHREIGPNYYDVILGPVLRSQARRVVGRYNPEEIYSTKREIIEREMRQAIEKAIGNTHLVLEAVLVRNVELPGMLQKAIVDKLTEEQNALRMKYVIDHEKEEAERKKIEAQGIAAFQEIVSARISEAFLRWKQIEALDRLALSPNAKVVMLGGGKELPMMMEPGR